MIAHLRGRLLSKTPNRPSSSAPVLATTSPSASPPSPRSRAKAQKLCCTFVPTSARPDRALRLLRDPGETPLQLLTISGIGPKLAITVRRHQLRPSSHRHPIPATATLTRIPASARASERVVLELKDKLDDLAVAIATGPHHGPAAAMPSALVNLGYAPVAQRPSRPPSREEPEAARRLSSSSVLPWPPSAETGQNKSQRVGVFSMAIHVVPATLSPQTTIYHQKPRFSVKFAKPQQKCTSVTNKKKQKKTPKPPGSSSDGP